MGSGVYAYPTYGSSSSSGVYAQPTYGQPSPSSGGTTVTSNTQNQGGVYAAPDYENTDWANFDYTAEVPPAMNPYPTSNSGYGYSSGGGGGTAVKPLSQEAYNAMLAAINRKGGQYQFDPWSPTPYQGMEISPFDDTLYRQAETALGQGYDQAGQRIGQGQADTRQGLQQNYQDYGQLRGMTTPTISPRQRGDLMGIGSGSGAARQANAENVNSDQAFQRFLAANEMVNSQAQGSRMNENDIAGQFYMNQLAQQRLADETGLGIAETKGKQDWQNRWDDRQYADSMLGQQWGREAGQFNNQGANQASQLNTQQSWSHLGDTLGPLMELIMAGNQAGLPVDIAKLLGG